YDTARPNARPFRYPGSVPEPDVGSDVHVGGQRQALLRPGVPDGVAIGGTDHHPVGDHAIVAKDHRPPVVAEADAGFPRRARPDRDQAARAAQSDPQSLEPAPRADQDRAPLPIDAQPGVIEERPVAQEDEAPPPSHGYGRPLRPQSKRAGPEHLAPVAHAGRQAAPAFDGSPVIPAVPPDRDLESGRPTAFVECTHIRSRTAPACSPG